MYNIFLILCTNLAVSTRTISIIAVIEVTIAMPILVVVELTLAKVTKEKMVIGQQLGNINETLSQYSMTTCSTRYLGSIVYL